MHVKIEIERFQIETAIFKIQIVCKNADFTKPNCNQINRICISVSQQFTLKLPRNILIQWFNVDQTIFLKGIQNNRDGPQTHPLNPNTLSPPNLARLYENTNK
jgi:hypothetical protein